jgi:hypothetical protein
MRVLLALIVVIYLVGVGVALSPTVQNKWTSVPASEFATSVAQALPRASIPEHPAARLNGPARPEAADFHPSRLPQWLRPRRRRSEAGAPGTRLDVRGASRRLKPARSAAGRALAAPGRSLRRGRGPAQTQPGDAPISSAGPVTGRCRRRRRNPERRRSAGERKLPHPNGRSAVNGTPSGPPRPFGLHK